MPLRGALRYSQRSGHLQTRFAQTMQVPLSERCSVAQHGLMAGDTSRLVRFANFAPVARSLRSPSRGAGLPHSSTLTSLKGTARRATTAFKDSGRTPTSSFRAQSRNPCSPAIQLGCCDYAQHDGVCRAPLPPSPTPFPVFPHPSLLPPHSSLLTPHSSLLTLFRATGVARWKGGDRLHAVSLGGGGHVLWGWARSGVSTFCGGHVLLVCEHSCRG